MSMPIDSTSTVQLRFFSAQQMSEARNQGMVVEQSAQEAAGSLQLGDYRAAQVQHSSQAEKDEIQERDRRRRNNEYFNRRKMAEADEKLEHERAVDPEADHIVNIRL